MNKIIKERTREQLARFLPDAIARALTDYQRFSEKAHEEAGDFAEHHKACKVALAHIELLLKLATIFDLPDARVGGPNDQIMLSVMMQEAREELTGYEGGQEGPPPGF